MKLELTDKEVALLMGLIDTTTGDAFQPLFTKLVDYATKNNKDIIEIAKLMSPKFKSAEYFINEDDIYDEAIMDWNIKEGIIKL